MFDPMAAPYKGRGSGQVYQNECDSINLIDANNNINMGEVESGAT
jgi:hypothetical protein